MLAGLRLGRRPVLQLSGLRPGVDLVAVAVTYDVTAAARLDAAAAYRRLADVATTAATTVTGPASGPGDEQQHYQSAENCLLDIARRLDALDGARRGAARGRNHVA